MKKVIIALTAFSAFFASCNNSTDSGTPTEQTATQEAVNIVSLNGAVSEILADLGMESQIVGVDVTSVYPESLKSKTQMGSSHSYNIEGIIANKPSYVISTQERGLSAEQVTQLKQAGINVWMINQEYSVDGTKQLITMLADTFKRQEKGAEIIAKLESDLAAAKTSDKKPKVLFIYARGAGTLNVAGKGTPMANIIELANGAPAMGDAFEGFKPLTAEAVVAANPDYILVFDTALKYLEGKEGVLGVNGVANTNAGKNKAVIVMDGLKLSGFGPRMGEAVKELSEQIHK